MTVLMNPALVIALFLLGVVISLRLWRWTDNRQATEVWSALERSGKGPVATFDSLQVKDLPEPARRYFLYSIAPPVED
ncbi:MAG TPA: hypothetical protein VMR74_10850 [Gammaproteobacteria bacterium]|nr:hypothetical protein [Gammaproteobacteria bacterium]